MSTFENKIIVITGASSGIGEATALAAAKKGARVVLSARREERLVHLVEEIKQMGGSAIFLKTDVTSMQQVQELADYTVNTYGSIDVWINNAGIMPLSSINKIKVHEWDQMIDVNIKGVLYGIAAAVPIMEEQKGGHIINVSSVAGHRVGIGGAVYSGTKFAIRAITEGLRLELSPTSNIRATIISPGTVATELRQTITDQETLSLLKKRNSGSALEAENIAESIIYAIEQPEGVSINEIIIRSTTMRF